MTLKKEGSEAFNEGILSKLVAAFDEVTNIDDFEHSNVSDSDETELKILFIEARMGSEEIFSSFINEAPYLPAGDVLKFAHQRLKRFLGELLAKARIAEYRKHQVIASLEDDLAQTIHDMGRLSTAKWVSAAAALVLLRPTMHQLIATKAICSRAFDGMVRARADRFVRDNSSADNVAVPKEFWWARGEAALEQNWQTGDFETWIDRRFHLRAFGVLFLRADIEKMIPVDAVEPNPAVAALPAASNGAAAQSEAARNKGGRPKREFWEVLWTEIARQLYVGELTPKTQADIESAMHQWISDRGHEAGETTVRERARMLWRAIEEDGN